MENGEKLFDTKTIANLILAFTVLFSVIYYLNYSDKIEDEVNTVIVSSLQDVNNSLVEHETRTK